jgi:hypothetical protein
MTQAVTIGYQVLGVLVVIPALWVARELLRHLALASEDNFLTRLAGHRWAAVMLWLAVGGLFAGMLQLILSLIYMLVQIFSTPVAQRGGLLGWISPGLTLLLFVASYAITYAAGRAILYGREEGSPLARLGGVERAFVWMTAGNALFGAVYGVWNRLLTLPIPLLQAQPTQPGWQTQILLGVLAMFLLGIVLFVLLAAAMGGWWPQREDEDEGDENEDLPL